MSTKLSKQDRAIQGLLTCPTVAHAAVHAKVGESTLRRWLKNDPDFQAAYRQARRQVFEQATAGLAALATEAVEELARIIRDPDAPNRDKLRAVHLVLTHARAASLGEMEELIERLDLALEQKENQR